jgi:hypothetical protein
VRLPWRQRVGVRSLPLRCRSDTSPLKFGAKAKHLFLWIIAWPTCTTSTAARCTRACPCSRSCSALQVMPKPSSQVHLIHGGAPQPAGQASGGVVRHAPYTAGSAAAAAPAADTGFSRSASSAATWGGAQRAFADCCCRSLPSTLPCAASSSSSTRAGRRRRRHTCGSGGTARCARFEAAALKFTNRLFFRPQYCPPTPLHQSRRHQYEQQ